MCPHPQTASHLQEPQSVSGGQPEASELPAPPEPLELRAPTAADTFNEMARQALPLMYPILNTAVAVLAIYAAVFPAQFVELVSGIKSPPANLQALAQFFGSSLFLPISALYALKEAVEHNRLGSDTYRRLNLGLLIWSLGLSVLVVLEPPALSHHVTTLVRAAAPFLVASTAVGYLAGSGANFSPAPLVVGLYGGIESVLGPKNAVAALYSASTAAVGLGGLLRLFQSIPGVLPNTPQALALLLLRSTGLGLLFASICLFTLKDAADRGRLGASTFKLLNLATLAASVFQLGVLGRSLASGLGVLSTRVLIQGGTLSLLAGLSAHQYTTAKK
eukprot:jgi/Botrbrau1/18351/Bobra.0179s0076.1